MSPGTGELWLVTHRDPLLWHGGGPTYVRAWAMAARECGLDPRIVTLGPPGESSSSDYGTVHRVTSPIGRYSSQTLPVNAPVLGRAVAKILGERPGHHVVHGFSGWPLLSSRQVHKLRRRGAHITRVQTAWTTVRHEQEAKFDSTTTAGPLRRRAVAERAWNLALTSRMQGRIMRTSDQIWINYRATGQILADEWGPDLPLRLVPYLPESAFTDDPGPAHLPPDIADLAAPEVPLIMTMSRHVARKGLDVLLHALALLRDRGLQFRACLPSTGRLLDAHRQLARDLGLAQWVRFPGLVDDPRAYIRAGDIFVLPSLEEGCGSVAVLEALQAAVPVVASDVDGMNEDLTDGVDGMLVASGDVAELTARLESLIRDPQLRARLGAAGQETFQRRFSRQVVVPQIGRLYEELGLRPNS